MGEMFSRVLLAAALATTGCDAIFAVDVATGIDAAPGLDASDAPLSETALVAHWPLDTLVSTGAVDVIRGRVLACGGMCPAQVASERGGALRFGASEWLAGAGDVALEMAQGFTVTAWVRLPANPEEPQCPFGKRYGTDSAHSWRFCVSDKAILFEASSGPIVSAGALAPGKWQHVALTWDGTIGQLYIDATIRTASALDPIEFDVGDIVLGYDEMAGLDAVPYVGDLDDLRIYARALTPTEILSLVLPSP